jgi:hypothetical protein
MVFLAIDRGAGREANMGQGMTRSTKRLGRLRVFRILKHVCDYHGNPAHDILLFSRLAIEKIYPKKRIRILKYRCLFFELFY